MPYFPRITSRTDERSTVTLASSTARPRPASHRGEVTTMMQRLQRILHLSLRQSARHTTLFNGQLLDQRREDVYAAMHQTGFLR